MIYCINSTISISSDPSGLTYRAEGALAGDATTWLYDEATGLLLSKTYADGHGPAYTYTDSGNLATRTWARGIVTTYSYDGWNSLTNTAYSDGTPTVSLAYDAMGRQTNAVDAAGQTATSYDAFGAVTGETTVGLYSKSLVHELDAFGRGVGYSLDSSRKSIVEYESDSGRVRRIMAGGVWFTYSYLAGTDLKSRLQYGASGYADYSYEPGRDLLTQVRNYVNGGVASQYDYVNDALGRRTEVARSGLAMTESRSDAYGYNDRGELTNAVKNATSTEYAYQYDDIGNRITSLDLGTNRTYTANNLNQYTLVGRGDPTAPQEEFTPQFDLDGNQTLIQTPTGIWQVQYNAENRPVLWTCGTTNITMKFDRMGRRVEHLETTGGPGAVPATTNAYHRFVYNGYLCVQRLDAANGNGVNLLVVWDPTEPVATRPLFMMQPGGHAFFCTHDGNKNVSEVFFFQQAYGIAAHYEYAPFGAVTAATRNTSVTSIDARTFNPYRFSSEYADDALGLVYYNYRHYNPVDGRWSGRDPIGPRGGANVYGFCRNLRSWVDVLGLAGVWNFDDHFMGSALCFKNYSDIKYINVSYLPSESERKCCHKIVVRRYVRKLLGTGWIVGSYQLDSDDEAIQIDTLSTGTQLIEKYFVEADRPSGIGIGVPWMTPFYRTNWLQDFKFVAICEKGPLEGTVLSEVQRYYRCVAHWESSRDLNGGFVDNPLPYLLEDLHGAIRLVSPVACMGLCLGELVYEFVFSLEDNAWLH